ncbi:MAG TPA: hypothetical protein PKC21_03325 [Oligoflexia bacterium]|nr:hypothetical protein [Oligoflexia bacterium]
MPIKAKTIVDQSTLIYENTLYTLHDVKAYLIVQQLLDGKDNFTFDKSAYQKAIDTMVQDFVIKDYLNKVDSGDEKENIKIEKKFKEIMTPKVLQLIAAQGQTEAAIKKAFFQEYDKEKFIRDSIAFRARVSKEDVERYYLAHQQDFKNQDKQEALIKIEQALKKSELALEYKQWLSRQLARKKIYLFSLDE